eukprot:191713_1
MSKLVLCLQCDSSGPIMPPPSQQQQQMTPTEIASTVDGILTLFFPDLSRYMRVNNPQPQEQEEDKTDDEAEEEFDLLRFETTYLSGDNFETHLEKIEFAETATMALYIVSLLMAVTISCGMATYLQKLQQDIKERL